MLVMLLLLLTCLMAVDGHIEVKGEILFGNLTTINFKIYVTQITVFVTD